MIGIILAVAVAIQAPPARFMPDGNADDQIDATCEKATDMAAGMARGEALDALLFVNAFYAGRVSGRATSPDWRKTVERDADKNLNNTNVGEVSDQCQKRMRVILKTGPLQQTPSP